MKLLPSVMILFFLSMHLLIASHHDKQIHQDLNKAKAIEDKIIHSCDPPCLSNESPCNDPSLPVDNKSDEKQEKPLNSKAIDNAVSSLNNMMHPCGIPCFSINELTYNEEAFQAANKIFEKPQISIEPQSTKKILTNSPKMLAGYNHPSRIFINNSWRFSLFGSLLYWMAEEQGNELAYERSSNDAKVINMKQDYHFGYRAGLTIFFNPDHWDLFSEYLRMHFSNNRSKIAQVDTYLEPIWMDEDNSEGSGNAKGLWKCKLDMIDLLAQRAYYYGKNVGFTFKAGLRGGNIRQRYDAQYHFTEMSNLLVASNNRSRSWFIGPRVGLNTNWKFFKNRFEVIADVGTSLMYQHYYATTKQDLTSTELHRNVKGKDDQSTPSIDCRLGIKGGFYPYKKSIFFDMGISYDWLYLWDQNFMRSLKDKVSKQTSPESGNLDMHGLTVSASIHF